MPRTHATLRTIAAESGFAASTVSMALRNDPSIPKQTRQFIKEVAARLDYRPNPLVSALMKQRRTAGKAQDHLPLALITRWEKPEPWKHGWVLPELFQGLRERADARGYRIEEFWLRAPGMTPRRLDRILIQRGISGVIVCSLPVARGHMRLSWERFAAVTIGYSLTRPVLHRIIGHHIHAVQIAFRHLRRDNYRRIGLVMRSDENTRVDRQWVAAFLGEQDLLASAQRVPPFIVPQTNWNQSAFEQWLRGSRPDVLLCVHPATIQTWLERLGYRIPHDIGLVDLYRNGSESFFAGTDPNAYSIGESATDMLIDQLQANERGLPKVPRTLLVEPVWRNGASVRGPKAIATNVPG